MKVPSRNPGEKIKDTLRKEVNFGCPVRYPTGGGCGCPVLTYHHFDPPWAGNYQHNLEGMIALCPKHHRQADGGLWSNEQIRGLKKSPYVNDSIRVQWPWQPETLVFKVGRSLVVGSGSPIRLDGHPIMRFHPHEIEGLGIKTTIFESLIRDSKGEIWVQITDGWLDLPIKGTSDFLYPPQTKHIIIKNDDSTYISLKYTKYTRKDLLSWTETFTSLDVMNAVEREGSIDSDGNVPVVIVEGKFDTEKVSVNIKGDDMHTQFRFHPGHSEDLTWKPWIVNNENRAIIRMAEEEGEIFSLG